ncbi:MAG: 30S ribosomal protein S13 [Parcubacteria group bacterium]|nr:30S ribosomal protein S13 [Parcubacteria group bacterium]
MRISGITIPEKKQLEFGLTALYGVGRSRARKILLEAGVAWSAKPADVSTEDENKIRRSIEQFKTEGDLKRQISSNIKRLKDIGSYRGSRHARRLPSRGQRTKTNSRTVRGNVRNTMGSGKRKVEKK